MSSPTPDWTAVVERLEKLERQNRRLKQAGAVALILAAAVLLMGQASPNRTVEANEFVLKDESGAVRGRFGMDESVDGYVPQLELLDADGQRRIWLSERRGWPTLAMFDANGRKEVDLRGSWSGYGPALQLESSGEHQVYLQTGPDGSSLAMGEVLGSLTLWESLERTDPRPTLFLAADENRSAIELHDAEGFQTTIGTTDLITSRTGETHKTSAASVVLFDKDKKVLWKAP